MKSIARTGIKDISVVKAREDAFVRRLFVKKNFVINTRDWSSLSIILFIPLILSSMCHISLVRNCIILSILLFKGLSRMLFGYFDFLLY